MGARASGAGGGGTFGLKPTGAGASGAGGGGASGVGPAGGTFGSKPIASALALADGTVTSVPVIAARMSVLRTFFKVVPFAVRAPKQTHGCGFGVLLSKWNKCSGTCRLVRARQRGRDRPASYRPPTAWRLTPTAAPLTRGSVDSIFSLLSITRFGLTGTVREPIAFVIFRKWIYRFDNEPITAG